MLLLDNSNTDILVVAARRNREVDGVIDQLRSLGLIVQRLETCQYPAAEILTWTSIPSKNQKNGAPKAGWICDLSGWSYEAHLEGLAREVAAFESNAFIDGSLLSMDCVWLNSPQFIRTASRKLFQLNIAQRIGLSIPETCITNSPVDAQNFCRVNPRVVAKTLGTSYVQYGGTNFKFFTKRVSELSNNIFENLRYGPMIFQEEIEKTEEIRVTVVDNKAFAVRLDLSKIETGSVDIRRLDYLKNKTSFSACKDRSDIITASLKITQELGLSYSGVDWAIDKFSTPYFLECNPLGAFKWFEICSGYDITGAIATALERRCKP